MRIPFDSKYKPQIESGEYKVETKSGFPAKIIHCDGYGEAPILVTVDLGDGCGAQTRLYFADGKLYKEESDADLFIVTQEEEMTEFEKALEVFLMNADSSEETFHEEVKKHAAKLLSLARDQFINDGYILEKKAFHDAVEKVSPEVMKEVSENIGQLTEFEERIFKLLRQYKECDIPLTPENIKAEASMLWPDFEKYFFDLYGREGEGDSALRSFYYRGLADGKAEALKDLPRWDDCWRTSLIDKPAIINQFLVYKGRKIILADLEKLPGFKEDE